MDAVSLYSTWPDAETAKAAARTLVERRLAACANILPVGTSVYRWNRAVQEDSESVMFLKTRAGLAESACAALLAMHPYATPCIITLRIEASGSNADFLAWVGAETG